MGGGASQHSQQTMACGTATATATAAQMAASGGQVSTASKQWHVGPQQEQQPQRRWQLAGGKSAQPANNGVWDCDSNSYCGTDGSQQGRHIHTAGMKRRLWDSTRRRRLQHEYRSVDQLGHLFDLLLSHLVVGDVSMCLQGLPPAELGVGRVSF